MPASASFQLTTRRLRSALERHAQRDPRVHACLKLHGFPRERRQPPGFATLVRALAGQQLSVKAAATIYGRLLDHCGADFAPERLVRTRTTTLRRLGLSERKAESLRALARARLDGALTIDAFDTLSDQAIIEQISAVKGFGSWSAQMYLLFSLGRPDVWPTGDLGVRKGLQTLLQMPECPSERATETLGEIYAPSRSAIALLCWHVKNNPTM